MSQAEHKRKRPEKMNFRKNVVPEDMVRFIELEQANVALERLAHATTNKGTVMASPLQARVSLRTEAHYFPLFSINCLNSLKTDSFPGR
jgi:hypothetical protein